MLGCLTIVSSVCISNLYSHVFCAFVLFVVTFDFLGLCLVVTLSFACLDHLFSYVSRSGVCLVGSTGVCNNLMRGWCYKPSGPTPVRVLVKFTCMSIQHTMPHVMRISWSQDLQGLPIVSHANTMPCYVQ